MCQRSQRKGKQRNWSLLQWFLPGVSLHSLSMIVEGDNSLIIYLPMLCQKVSSIYHNLTFSDPSQVSRGPNKESTPQATAYQAPKVKHGQAWNHLSAYDTCLQKFTSTSFRLKLYDFTSDSLTTKCQKAPSVRWLRWGTSYQEAAPPYPSPSSSIIAFQACIGKSPKLCYVWREQNALEIS